MLEVTDANSDGGPDEGETEMVVVPEAARVLILLPVLGVAATLPLLFIAVSMISRLGCCSSRTQPSNLSEPLLPVS